MQVREDRGIHGKTFVVTGGLGFVGAVLSVELVRRGAREVRTLDIRSCSPSASRLSEAGVVSILGDITNQKDVNKALKGADCVFHVASYGTSGKEMLQIRRIDEVNVNGTCLILDACIELGIKRLVYVSTNNVVFADTEIINGDEKLPYLPLDHYLDTYSRSKAIAEQLVHKYNGRPLREKKDGCLYTCAVRSAAIYGPGEDRYLQRIVTLAKLGLLFRIGDSTVKTDFIYIDNLVLALLLASMGLTDDDPGSKGRLIAAGQSYFVSDGSPVNTFEHICPLVKSLEYNFPKASLTVNSALVFGKLCWMLYTILYPWLNTSWLPQPLILPAEVHQVGVTHYFSIVKAKQELGYVPTVSPRDGMAATISYWQDWKRKSLYGPTIYPWLFCIFGLSAFFLVTCLPNVGPVPFFRKIAVFIFGSMRNVHIAFSIVTTAHVSQAIYAWFLAKKVDPANADGWFWQTLVLAMFSLRLLLKRARAPAQISYSKHKKTHLSWGGDRRSKYMNGHRQGP